MSILPSSAQQVGLFAGSVIENIALGDFQGLPNDGNYLNQHLEESNQLFVELLEIEDECQ